MPSRRFSRPFVVLAVVAATGTAAAVYAVPSPGTVPRPVLRLELAGANNPIGSRGRTLGLSKVIVPAGVALGLHHHPGTQVAYIASGTLTYSVKAGSVTVMKGPAPTGTAVLRIRAGHSGSIHTGEWIVEEPTTVHSAANKGTKPVVIYLATLFPIGSPPAIPNK
jgi:quercetin dioxygenase-like cupin family protein